MERRTGDVIGTKADRPGMDFSASGDPTQQDCVDEATNTTSYLLILERNGFLRHHVVGTPFSKENLLRGVAGWPHWTAVLKEHVGGQKWAVDSWIYANGENPAVVETEKWYIASLEELPALDAVGVRPFVLTPALRERDGLLKQRCQERLSRVGGQRRKHQRAGAMVQTGGYTQEHP